MTGGRPSALAFIVAAALTACVALAAPSADPWPRWQAHDESATAAIDHGAWAVFLARYAVAMPGAGTRVAYGRVTTADRAALAAYVDGLAAVPISRYRRDEQEAYWINLYNALTVRTVLAHYPVASIRDITTSPGLFASGPWGEKQVTIEGERLSLDDIEHRILRPFWRDPRLHYALNCAALGCPDLQRQPFTAASSETMLDAAARAYVNDTRGARFEDGRLVVSSIYIWYKPDFGGSDAAIIAHLRRYAAPALAARLDATSGIADDRYDWALNDAPSDKGP